VDPTVSILFFFCSLLRPTLVGLILYSSKLAAYAQLWEKLTEKYYSKTKFVYVIETQKIAVGIFVCFEENETREMCLQPLYISIRFFEAFRKN